MVHYLCEEDELSDGIEAVDIDDEEERISLSFDEDVVTLSDDIARGLSPRIRSINHL